VKSIQLSERENKLESFLFECRLQLALSKSTTADIDLTNANIEIKMIEDVLCKVQHLSGYLWIFLLTKGNAKDLDFLTCSHK
jgi:hypothetical protein